MKAFTYSLVVLMQLTFIVGTSVSVQHKCWLWDTPCLTALAQAAVPAVTAGSSQLGIDPLDPVVVDGLHISDGGLQIDWSTTAVLGMGKSVVDEIRVDLNSKLIRLVFRSNLLIKSNYYVPKATLFSMPIEGAGEVTIEFYNVQMEIVMPFEIIKNLHGRDVIDLQGFQYWYEMDGARMYFDNLYYGNIELSQRMHRIINKNWKLLTTKYGRYLFDKTNKKVFNAIRTLLHLQPIETYCWY